MSTFEAQIASAISMLFITAAFWLGHKLGSKAGAAAVKEKHHGLCQWCKNWDGKLSQKLVPACQGCTYMGLGNEDNWVRRCDSCNGREVL